MNRDQSRYQSELRYLNQKKTDLIKRVRLHGKDTGSADVQIAVLTNMLDTLKSQYDSQTPNTQGMKNLLQQGQDRNNIRIDILRLLKVRRNLIDYLKSTDTSRYKNIISILNIDTHLE